ncbi:radical SAM protein [Candidatus Fermentibacteria bacterium]|nr:radical SAM protein [Candidatus Fermentibacteria bacterium]
MFISPRVANILITGKCNIHCRHCTVKSHGSLGPDLPLKDWCKIFDKLAKEKLLKLALTGGEPLFRKDFPELMNEVCSRPFRVEINTNGTVLDDGIIDSLKAHRKRLDAIMVALDGPDSKTVDWLRGKGVFKRTLENIERLHSEGFPLCFYCTVHSRNVRTIAETAELARAFDAEIKFNHMMLSGPDIPPELEPSLKQIRWAGKILYGIDERYPGTVSGTILSAEKHLRSYLEGSIIPKKGQPSFGCGICTLKITVFPDGSVRPCDHLPSILLGNLLESGLEQILNNEVSKNLVRLINKPIDERDDCRDCQYKPYCSGGCPVYTLDENSMYDHDPLSCLALYGADRL